MGILILYYSKTVVVVVTIINIIYEYIPVSRSLYKYCCDIYIIICVQTLVVLLFCYVFVLSNVSPPRRQAYAEFRARYTCRGADPCCKEIREWNTQRDELLAAGRARRTRYTKIYVCVHKPVRVWLCTWRQPLGRPRWRSANPSERPFRPPPRRNPGTLVKDIDPAAERARHAAVSVVPARHHNIHTRRTFRDASRARRAFIYLFTGTLFIIIYSIIIITTVYTTGTPRIDNIIVYNEFIRYIRTYCNNIVKAFNIPLLYYIPPTITFSL